MFQGASCLLDWADWSGELNGKTVLELGSGLGQVCFLVRLCATNHNGSYKKNF